MSTRRYGIAVMVGIVLGSGLVAFAEPSRVPPPQAATSLESPRSFTAGTAATGAAASTEKAPGDASVRRTAPIQRSEWTGFQPPRDASPALYGPER